MFSTDVLSRRRFFAAVTAAGAAGLAASCGGGSERETPQSGAPAAETPVRKPNIIFILADDLGYGDVGCYGQNTIQTPNIDRLASEGVRFTDAYAGSTVCAPSRSCLMTGQHTGHTWIRGNGGKNGERVPLRGEDVTVAEVLKGAGYSTGIVGKWGLGEPDTTGIPNRQGFDYWFGYLNQRRAHNYYPDYLWRNEDKYVLEGNVVRDNVAVERAQYSHDLFTREALEFIERNADTPFFLYLPYTIPHANNEAGGQGMEVPDDAPYSDRDWPQQQKNHAAMITRMDRDIGVIMDKLDQLGITEDTLVIFSSDNGPHREGGGDPDFFDANGPYRGIKRDLYEGGIRVPFITRWKGTIRPGRVSDHMTAFWDFLPTAADVAGAETPSGLDGISLLPTLLEDGGQREHEYLYWEFHEGRGTKRAIRMGRWKGVQNLPSSSIELYDLESDPGETTDIADEHPDIVNRIGGLMVDARSDSPHWDVFERTAR